MDAKSIYKGHADEASGEFRIRRCGCYWEYCDGCCNSCDKSKFYTSTSTGELRMDAKSVYRGHADEASGEFRIRRCGCYWEYCDGCCNSCDKSKFYTSNHTTMLETGPYVSDSTAPKAYLGSTVPRDLSFFST